MKKEIKIGITGIVALVILYMGINFLKGVSLFSTDSIYYIQFTNAKGLSKNTTVYADGYNVGIVSNIIYDYKNPGKVLIEISTNKNLRVPKGTTASLDEAMLGGCTLNMKMGNNPLEAYEPGDTIPGSDEVGLMTKAADMVPQLEVVVAKVDTLVATLNTLLADPNLPLIIKNAELITENLNQSSEQLNTLLRKDIPQMTNTFNKAGENVVTLTDNLNKLDLQATMNNVNTTISNVDQMMTEIQSPNGTLGKLMKDPAIYNNLNHTIQSADSLVTDLKSRPSRYVHFSLFGKKEK